VGFAVGSVAGFFQCGHKIFLALTPEFFLGRLEAGDPRGDFFRSRARLSSCLVMPILLDSGERSLAIANGA